jgi:sec-independent protein translocase protein TatC
VRGTIATPTSNKQDLREMSFLDHLDELRKVIVQSATVFFVAMVVCWFFSGRVLDFLVRPLPVEHLVFTDPSEAFLVRMRISLVLGLMITFPFILFRVWAFVAPGLFAHERKKVLPFILASSALFYTGVVFCYVVLVPIVLQFLLSYRTPMLDPLISVNSYFAFVWKLSFAFGIVFQLPIVVLLLTLLGIVTPQWLLRQWRYGVVGIAIAAAVFTPPDVISMIAMGVPLLVLYAVSVLIAFVVVRKKDRPSGGGGA